MNKYIVLSLLMAVALFGLFLVGEGITGMAVEDSNIKMLCELDSDCARSEVCCLFYEEQAGVCHDKGACAGILELTKEETQSEEVVSVSLGENVKTKNDYTVQIMLGAFILAAAGVLFYFHALEFKKEKHFA